MYTATCILVIVIISIGQAVILDPSDEPLLRPKLNNSLVSASTSVHAGWPNKWTLIFQSDGKTANTVDKFMKVCGVENVYKDDIIRVTVGKIKDYLRPIDTTTLCDFLTKYKTADGKARTYLWSSTETGTYSTLTWWHVSYLGSSYTNADDRKVPIWGHATALGGWGYVTNKKYGGGLSSAAWGRAVTIELQTKRVSNFEHIQANGYVTVGGGLNVASAIHASNDLYVDGNIVINGELMSGTHSSKLVDVDQLKTKSIEVSSKFVAGSDNTMAKLTVSQELATPSAVISNTLFVNGQIRNKDVNKALDLGKISTSDISGSGNITTKGHLSVTGSITTSGRVSCGSVHVGLGGGADFVFDESYSLMSLSETEQFINTKKHLPGVTSAEDMKSNGIDLGKFQLKLLQKIEELTVHSIHMKKQITNMEKEIEKLKV